MEYILETHNLEKRYKKFKSISNIQKLTYEELSEVLPKDVALRVYNKFRGDEDARNNQWLL